MKRKLHEHNSLLAPVQKTYIINQKGEKNIYINKLKNLVIKILPWNTANSNSRPQYLGKIKLSAHDEGLLNELKKDYKEDLQYWINTDFSECAFSLDSIGRLTSNENKWKFKWREFESKEIRDITSNMLQNFRLLLNCINMEYFRFTNRDEKLVFRNETPEDLENQETILAPTAAKVRNELTNVYCALWPV